MSKHEPLGPLSPDFLESDFYGYQGLLDEAEVDGNAVPVLGHALPALPVHQLAVPLDDAEKAGEHLLGW